MLYREIIAVCSQIHTEHTNTLCGRNVELLIVEPGGTYGLEVLITSSTKSVKNILKMPERKFVDVDLCCPFLLPYQRVV